MSDNKVGSGESVLNDDKYDDLEALLNLLPEEAVEFLAACIDMDILEESVLTFDEEEVARKVGSQVAADILSECPGGRGNALAAKTAIDSTFTRLLACHFTGEFRNPKGLVVRTLINALCEVRSIRRSN